VAQLQVDWPSLWKPLRLHVHGLSVKLQQLQAPPVSIQTMCAGSLLAAVSGACHLFMGGPCMTACLR
jgi:hypothetical protein